VVVVDEGHRDEAGKNTDEDDRPWQANALGPDHESPADDRESDDGVKYGGGELREVADRRA